MVDTDSKSTRLACCIVAFVFVFIIMVFAICWTNQENFENFTNVVKYNNDTIKNVLSGGIHYKALNTTDDILQKFKDLDRSNKVALVAILAPWCGYCKRLKSSGVLTKVSKKFPVIVMDDQHPQVSDVMHLLQAEGFPALGIYFQGQLLPYRGPREEKELVATMTEIKSNIQNPHTGRTIENFANQKPSGQIMAIKGDMGMMEYNKMVKDISKKGGRVCTAFMADWCGHCRMLKQSGVLEQLAESGVVVLTADDTNKLTNEMKIQGFPTLYCFTKGRNVPYQGDRSYEAIISVLGK